jgi:flagellar biosynthesis GTPase FlhF
MGGFEGALASTGETFATVGNVLIAVSETFRYLFNVFETFGNGLAIALGKVIENIGWLFGDESAQQFGKGMADAASVAMKRNQAEYQGAKANANAAADRAIFGGEMSGEQGAAGAAVAGAREAYNNRNSPEAQLEREAREAKKKADREAASAARIEEQKTQDMAKQHDKTIAEAKKKADDEAKAAEKIAADQARAAEKAAADAQRAADKQAADRERAVSGAEASNESMDKAVAGASEFKGENAALLGTKSKEALQANDIRSSEGIGQFMALATGRDDPALVEYRKQTSTLMQLLAEQRAQRVENATILGGAAA